MSGVVYVRGTVRYSIVGIVVQYFISRVKVRQIMSQLKHFQYKAVNLNNGV